MNNNQRNKRKPIIFFYPKRFFNILIISPRDRFRPATATAAAIPGLRRISGQTVRNRLRSAGLRNHRPAHRVVLTPRRRRARLAWTRAHSRWTLRQWRDVAFTDESRFCLQMRDGRVRVYRRRGERFAANCVLEADRNRGGSVMIWGEGGGDFWKSEDRPCVYPRKFECPNVH